MSIWKTLFSSGNVVEKGVDAAINAGDKLALTKEERLDYHLVFLKAYEPFKIAQRFLALIVGIPYVVVFLLCAVSYLAASIAIDPVACIEGCRADSVVKSALALGQLNQDTLGMPFWTIIGFYFAGGTIEGGIRAWKEKP